MTEAMFQRLVERAEAQSAKRGPAKVPEDRSITLYVAAQGGTITVANVVELSLVESVLEARTRKGELFLLPLDGVLAASISADGERSPGRKAGFLG